MNKKKLIDYINGGFRLVPISSNKEALIKWSETTITSEEDLGNYFDDETVGVAFKINGFWVLDLDVKGDDNGILNLNNYMKENGYELSDNIPTVKTPSGGMHYYFKATDDSLFDDKINVRPGIDRKGYNSLIIAPPTERYNDKKYIGEYKWINNPIDAVDQITEEAPDWLIKYVCPNGNHRQTIYTLIDKIRNIPQNSGIRQEFSNKYTYLIGQYCGANKFEKKSGLSIDSIKNDIVLAMEDNGLEDYRIKDIITRSFSEGMRKPKDIENITDDWNKKMDNYIIPADTQINIGLAEIINNVIGNKYIRYEGDWFVSTPVANIMDDVKYTTWEPVSEDIVKVVVHGIVKNTLHEKKTKKDVVYNRIDLNSNIFGNVCDALLSPGFNIIITSKPKISSDMLVTENYIIDINTLQARKIQPEDYILPKDRINMSIPDGWVKSNKLIINTKIAPPKWTRFVKEILTDDQESIDLLQEYLGYSLTTNILAQKFLVLYGKRATGKTLIADIMYNMIGEHGISVLDADNLAMSSFALEPLIDSRLVIMNELKLSTNNSDAFDTKIKSITGGDTISINRKYKTSKSSKLKCKILALTNELPSIVDESSALSNRMFVLNTRRPKNKKPDLRLLEKLLTEKQDIFMWMLVGLKRLVDRDFNFIEPQKSKDLVEDIRSSTSPLKSFIEENYVIEINKNNNKILFKDLYIKYRSYCEINGNNSPSKIKLSKQLKNEYHSDGFYIANRTVNNQSGKYCFNLRPITQREIIAIYGENVDEPVINNTPEEDYRF